MVDPAPDVAGAAQDAMIVLTGALAHRKEITVPEATATYKDAVVLAMRGKSASELAIMIAALGDTAAEFLRHIAETRDADPDELLRELALSMRRSFEEHDDDES